MIEVLLGYLISIIVIVSAFLLIHFYLKKKLNARMSWSLFFVGILVSVLYFIIVFLLFKASFLNGNFYNTPFFQAFVGTVYLILLAAFRNFLVKALFFNKYHENAGYSFCFGFGYAPAAFIGIFCLIMFLIVAGNGLFNGPATVLENGRLCFADNTIIEMTGPIWGYVTFGIITFAFSGVLVLCGNMLWKISEQKLGFWVSVIWFSAFTALEASIVGLIHYILYGLNYWIAAMIALVILCFAVALIRFIPKKKKDSKYTKQFE